MDRRQPHLFTQSIIERRLKTANGNLDDSLIRFPSFFLSRNLHTAQWKFMVLKMLSIEIWMGSKALRSVHIIYVHACTHQILTKRISLFSFICYLNDSFINHKSHEFRSYFLVWWQWIRSEYWNSMIGKWHYYDFKRNGSKHVARVFIHIGIKHIVDMLFPFDKGQFNESESESKRQPQRMNWEQTSEIYWIQWERVHLDLLLNITSQSMTTHAITAN